MCIRDSTWTMPGGPPRGRPRRGRTVEVDPPVPHRCVVVRRWHRGDPASVGCYWWSLMHRFFHWCEDHAFVVTLGMFGFLLVIGIGTQSWQSNKHTSEVRAEATERAKAVEREAKARAEALAASNLDVCKRAVTAVTNQLN